MKKIAGIIAVTLLITGIFFVFNSGRIYKLTDTTARFVPHQPVPAGLTSLKAEACGACHMDIYQEWQTSLHAKAFSNPFFTAYLKKDKGDPTCLICHTPLQNQSPVILSSKSGLYDDLTVEPNPQFDAELQREGVNCSGCHVRDGVIYGPYKMESMNAPHAVAFDEKFLNNTICNQCHEVPSKKFSLMTEGICSTGSEFSESPWARKGVTCQGCHMQAIKRPLVKGFPARPGKRHLWPGGYSFAQLRKVFRFKAEKVGQELTITITNSGAGHKAPSGDPDRFIVLDFWWKDSSGQSTKLESIQFKRQMVWKPVMFVWSDNRLAPGESMQLVTRVPEGRGSLLVDGTYHVMTQWSHDRLRDKYELKIDPSNDEWKIQRPFLKQQRIEINRNSNFL